MEKLIILNTISIWCLIFYFLLKPIWSRLEFKMEKTLFREIPYGFSITYWDNPIDSEWNSGQVIFQFNWRNEEKIIDKP